MDGFFLGLAGRLLRISLRLCPRELPRSSPASPRKTLSITPVVLGLTQSLPLIGLRWQPGCLEQIWIAALTALWLPPAPPGPSGQASSLSLPNPETLARSDRVHCPHCHKLVLASSMARHLKLTK